MSLTDKTLLDPSVVWGYASRTLTQAKFPFWSSIIAQTGSVFSVAGTSISYVSIQPVPGETWLVWIDCLIQATASASMVRYYDYDGATARLHVHQQTGGSYGDVQPHIGLLKVLTNSLYARLAFENNGTASVYGSYGYSGFKLSQPIWKPKPVSPMSGLPWKRKTDLPLPPAISALDKFKAEVLGVDPSRPNDYGLAVILEEDTPLAVDPNTGFPVERLTAVPDLNVQQETPC
jgi:hypothetical protein